MDEFRAPSVDLDMFTSWFSEDDFGFEAKEKNEKRKFTFYLVMMWWWIDKANLLSIWGNHEASFLIMVIGEAKAKDGVIQMQ